MKRLILLLILCFALAQGAYGQAGATAQLSGMVSDPTSASVGGSTLTVRSLETGQARVTKTSEDGHYVLTNLAPGFYEITAEATGFARLRVPRLELTVGQQATLNLTLEVAGAAQEVTVTTSSQVVDPTRTEISQVIEERRIENLPINGRQFLDFVLLTPNVDVGRSNNGNPSTPGEPKQIDISFAGLHETTSLVTVDGANNMNRIFGRSRSTPSQEAVREFRVLTNSYAAESGPATGAIVSIITKSGTNDLHGSALYYTRNNALDAANILAPPGFDELRQHQFGGTLGGPIARNKFFLFGSYEGQRREESPFYSTLLLNNLGAINAVKLSFGLPPEVLEGKLRVIDYDDLLVRSDYQVSSRNALSLIYRYRNDRYKNISAATGQLSAPSNFRDADIDDHALVFNSTSILSAELVNQALFQFARRTFSSPSVSFEPHLQLANTLDMGRHFNAVDGSGERRFEFGDALTYTRGEHTFKFGGSFYNTSDDFFYDQFDPAFAIFPNLNAFLGRPPFPPFPFAVVFGFSIAPNRNRPPAALTWTGPVNLPVYDSFVRAENSQFHYALFGQDQWRLTPKLTLNYGLRWDVDNLPSQYYKTYYKAFQPRVGVAYSILSDRLVLRAGGGYFQGERYTLGYLDQMVSGMDPGIAAVRGAEDYSLSPGTLRSAFISNPTVATQSLRQFLQTGLYPAITGPGLLPAQDFFLTNKRDNHGGPFTYQWNAQVDFAVSTDMALSLSYVGVRGLALISAFAGNVAPAIFQLPNGKRDYAVAPNVPVTRVINTLAAPLSLFFDDTAQSTYHSGTLSLIKRFSHNYSFTANYTYSKSIDNSSSPSLNGYPEDPYARDLERARSKQDVPHRFVGNFTAEGPQKTWLRDFRFSFIANASSAHYFTIFAGTDVNHDGNATTDRVATLGRNTYKGDSYVNFDARLSRVIRFSERVRAEAIVEAFNLFNTLNVTEVSTVYGAPDFIGPIPREFAKPVIAPLSSFGTIRAIAPPRQIQFAVRLNF